MRGDADDLDVRRRSRARLTASWRHLIPTAPRFTPAQIAELTVGTPPFQLAFDGSKIWVTNEVSNTVTKLRAADGVNLGTFNVGTNPAGVVFDGVNV